MIGSLFTNPISFFFVIIALLAAITIHEFSHAFTADYLGDPTARLAGRMKLNPLVHLDIYGTLFILFTGFGWGKPVPVDHFNLKNPRKDGAIISLSGPTSNLILAIVLSFILRLIPQSNFFNIFISLLEIVIIFNVSLGIFNLLPIFPLDGFSIIAGLLPEDKAEEWQQLQRYGLIFLLLLIFPFGNSSMISSIIQPIISFILQLLLPENPTGGLV